MVRRLVVLVALGACGDDGGPSIDAPVQSECAAPTGSGTDHAGTISQPETWTEAGSPHRITSELVVSSTLTIEPCATVLLAGNTRVYVGSTSEPGSIVARGTTTRRITFDAITATAKWGQIIVEPRGTLDLASTSLLNGGAIINNESGALLVNGVATGTNDGAVTRSAKLVDVRISGSGSYGLNLNGWGGLDAASSDITIESSGSTAIPYPVRVEPGIVETLPELSLANNMVNEIEIRTSKAFMRSDRFGHHGVPYRVTGLLYVNGSADGAPVKLTLDPGVTIAFADATSGISVGSTMTRQGILEAIGTLDAPVRFTSAKATKTAGDWRGLNFRATPTTGSRISHAIVEYAGADSQTNSFGCGPTDNDGAVIIQGTGGDQMAPASAFIDMTSFDNISGTTVIVSGWISDSGPNFSTGNSFGASTPACKVSKPRRTGTGDVCDGGRTTCWP